MWWIFKEIWSRCKKAKKIIKEQLEKELSELASNLNETNKVRYEQLKKELDQIIEQEVKGCILRSLCKNYEEGEKITFSLEKFKAKQKRWW